jgi:hypothetical protein
MPLYPDALLADLQRLPGGGHCFLKQLAEPTMEPLRARLEELQAAVGPEVAERWADQLTSLDNRRFFQAFSEAWTAGALLAAGWRPEALAWPGPNLLASRPHDPPVEVLVLGFVRQVRPLPDRAISEKLARAVNRVASRSRVAILVRRWLPHDFDPEPVRRAIEMWLKEVDRGGWDGRYAAYDDEAISLEFALTGESASAQDGVVAFTVGPFDAHRSMEAMERRIIAELDRHRAASPAARPLLVSCVSDQPWRLSPGYVRDLLYGKPCEQAVTVRGLELTWGPEYSPSLFRDPFYSHVSGLLLIDRPTNDPVGLRMEAFFNPWSPHPLHPAEQPWPTLGLDRWSNEGPTLRWHNRLPSRGLRF